MHVVQRTRVSWIIAPNMAAYTDWKILIDSDSTTGVNLLTSSVIEFEPFQNTQDSLIVDDVTLSPLITTISLYTNLSTPVK
jgi:hypothetical protein